MITKLPDKLAKNVKALRLARGLSQEQLAARSGVNRSTISTIENGTANPTLTAVVRLAETLGVKMEELLSTFSRGEIKLYSSDMLKQESLSQGKVFKVDLLPQSIPGLQFEQLVLRPQAGLQGIPHLRGTWEYFTCVKGKVLIHVDGEEFQIEKGAVLSFPGHKNHSYRNPTKDVSVGVSVVYLEDKA